MLERNLRVNDPEPENPGENQSPKNLWERGKERFSGWFDKLKSKVTGKKILGKSIPEIVGYAAVGAAARFVTRESFSLLGAGGLPLIAATGALIGGVESLGRGYCAQRGPIIQEYEIPEVVTERPLIEHYRQRTDLLHDTPWNRARTDEQGTIYIREPGLNITLKNIVREFKVLPHLQKRRLLEETAKGVVMGAVGGLFGALLFEGVRSLSSLQLDVPQWAQDLRQKIADIGSPSFDSKQADLVIQPPLEQSFDIEPERQSFALEPEEGIGSEQSLPGVQQPEAQQLPPPIDVTPKTFEMPEGSNLWSETRKFLENSLNRPPTNTEIAQGVQRIILENNLPNGNSVNAGESLKISSLSEMLPVPKPSVPSLPNALPGDLLNPPSSSTSEVIPLKKGDSLWSATEEFMRNLAGREVDQLEVLPVAQEVAKQSGVHVSGWIGTEGGKPHTGLDTGFPLKFNDSVKNIASQSLALAH